MIYNHCGMTYHSHMNNGPTEQVYRRQQELMLSDLMKRHPVVVTMIIMGYHCSDSTATHSFADIFVAVDTSSRQRKEKLTTV